MRTVDEVVDGRDVHWRELLSNMRGMAVSQEQYNYTKDRVKAAEVIISKEGISDEAVKAITTAKTQSMAVHNRNDDIFTAWDNSMVITGNLLCRLRLMMIRPPQIALSARLSSRHIVPTFENTLKMAGTFRKGYFYDRHKIIMSKPTF